jgi:hypothetical protein
MLNEDERHANIGGYFGDKFRTGFQTAGGCPDADDGKLRAGARRTVDRVPLPALWPPAGGLRHNVSLVINALSKYEISFVYSWGMVVFWPRAR